MSTWPSCTAARAATRSSSPKCSPRAAPVCPRACATQSSRAQPGSPPAARELLDTAAVIGMRADAELLGALVQAGVEECLAAGVLQRDERGVAFRHELARQAVEEAIEPLRRAELHRRVLAALRRAPCGRSRTSRAPRRGLGRRGRSARSTRKRPARRQPNVAPTGRPRPSTHGRSASLTRWRRPRSPISSSGMHWSAITRTRSKRRWPLSARRWSTSALWETGSEQATRSPGSRSSPTSRPTGTSRETRLRRRSTCWNSFHPGESWPAPTRTWPSRRRARSTSTKRRGGASAPSSWPTSSATRDVHLDAADDGRDGRNR